MAGVDAMNLNIAARLPSVAVLDALGSRDRGLDSSEAAARLEAYRANVLREHRVTVTGILLRQFRNPLLLLLLGCAAVSGFTGDPTDAVIIAAIVAVTVLLSFVNEYRAESAVEALHQEIHHRALVRRDGLDQLVDTITLVPGDVVSLSVGNIVPADMRLLEVDSLDCDEAVLTGESLPVAKTGQLAIPTDAVDSETLARPAAWDLAFVRRFMIVFGPVSSVFDFLTFFVMLDLLNANHSEFRTGWFVESLATQTLVIYVIRTRRVPFVRSRPSLAMLIVPPL
jgi:magnesium-transporting ATPase (P-type)